MNRIEKENICEKYKEHLKLIYLIGNKLMLQTDFIEMGKLLNIIKSDYEANKIITILEESNLIRKEQFLDTKYKLLILRKFPIMYIENKNNSSQVAGVPKHTTTRAIDSVIKCYYFKRFIKKMQKEKRYMTLENYIKVAKLRGSTYLYKKNCGLEYLNLISHLNFYIKENEVYKTSIHNNEVALKNRAEGHKKRLHKGTKGKLNADNRYCLESKINGLTSCNDFADKLNNITIDTLLNANIYN